VADSHRLPDHQMGRLYIESHSSGQHENSESALDLLESFADALQMSVLLEHLYQALDADRKKEHDGQSENEISPQHLIPRTKDRAIV